MCIVSNVLMLVHASKLRQAGLLELLTPALQARSFISPSVFLHYPSALKPQTKIIPSKVRPSAPEAIVSDISLLQRVLSAKDAQSFIKHWNALQARDVKAFLGTAKLVALSQRIASLTGFKGWDSETRTAIDNIALKVSSTHNTDGLYTCLRFHLKNNNPQAVINLYQKHMQSIMDREVGGQVEGAEDHQLNQEYHALHLETRPMPKPLDPGRVYLLLAVTTAHAMRDSYADALETCLATVVRFHDYTTMEFLRQLGPNARLRAKVQTYVERLAVSRLVARPPSLSKHVSALAKANSLQSIEKLYEKVILGIIGPEPYLAADPSRITPSLSISMTELGWTSFLAAFLKCERRDLATKVWDDLIRCGVRPGTSTWTALIDSFARIGATKDALSAWEMMLAQGGKPDGLTYRAIISALFHDRRPDAAIEKFNAFQKSHENPEMAAHTLAVHNTVLNGLLHTNRSVAANEVMINMHENGPKPDLVSYNTFLGHYSRLGDFKGLAAVVSKMSSEQIAGDVFSYSTILSALLKIGKQDAPETILQLMRNQGIQPNVAIYTAIINHQLREKNEKNLAAALFMLQTMEQDSSAQPNEVTYSSVLAGLYRDGWLAPEKAEEFRKNIVARMKARGVVFRLPTYHILLKACLDYPYPEGLNHALAYFEDMRRHTPLVQTTWYILLAGLLQRGEWAIAEEYVKEMKNSDVSPSASTMQLVRQIRRRGK